MKLSKIPTGTLDGTLNGVFEAGTTHITGTATSGTATYAIDVTK